MCVGCQGTETGNPAKSYSNDDFGVSAQYDSEWSSTDRTATAIPMAAPCPTCDTTGPTESGIDTSEAASAVFTDGTSTVTLFYVTLDQTPASLEDYLATAFSPPRTFEPFANTHISGFFYDNPEAGATGGDRREYYFLQDVTLLYVVTDLFDTGDGFEKADTILDSLRFE